MAVVRCKEHGQPRPRIRNYTHVVVASGGENTALICGRTRCENPGEIWLEDDEWDEYQRGERIFEIPSNAVKVKAA